MKQSTPLLPIPLVPWLLVFPITTTFHNLMFPRRLVISVASFWFKSTYLVRVDQITDHTGWLHLSELLCSPRDNKRARRSQLHLSKHLTRAIHKQSCTLTHFLPRNVFFYPLGLRGIACFACRVPLFVPGNSCILPQYTVKGRYFTKGMTFPLYIIYDESLLPR